jgi:hypothetical protein
VDRRSVFRRVRDHLAVAREYLVAGGKPATSAVIGLLGTIERQLEPHGGDYRGDAQTARSELERIIDKLSALTARRPGVATGSEKLKQDPEKVLLPGVDGALEQLRQAVELLKGDGIQAREPER